MGWRKQRSALRIVGAATVDGAVIASTATTLTGAVTMSSAASVAQQLTASTSVDIGAALIMNVSILSTTQTVAAGGGMLVLGDNAGSASTYDLPTSTAGTMYIVYFSSAAAANTVVRPADATNTLFWGLPSTMTAKLATYITGTTGCHFIVVAQSSSQWNIVSYSTNLTSSS